MLAEDKPDEVNLESNRHVGCLLVFANLVVLVASLVLFLFVLPQPC